MKFTSFIFAILLFTVSNAWSQTTNLDITWDANPTADAVISYTVTLTSTTGPTIPPVTVVATTACTASGCVAKFLSVPLGNYTASVVATNEWGTSVPGTGSLAIIVPVQVKNVKGRKG